MKLQPAAEKPRISVFSAELTLAGSRSRAGGTETEFREPLASRLSRRLCMFVCMYICHPISLRNPLLAYEISQTRGVVNQTIISSRPHAAERYAALAAPIPSPRAASSTTIQLRPRVFAFHPSRFTRGRSPRSPLRRKHINAKSRSVSRRHNNADDLDRRSIGE